MTGCAVPKYKESNKSKQLRHCVNNFLDRDVSPRTGIKVCERIYKRIK